MYDGLYPKYSFTHLIGVNTSLLKIIVKKILQSVRLFDVGVKCNVISLQQYYLTHQPPTINPAHAAYLPLVQLA